MKRARFRRWIAGNRFCRCGPACRNGAPMITNGTGPQRCLPPWMFWKARSSANANRGIGIRNLRFLDRIDESIDPGLDIHLVLDNYGTHKHPEVKKWLAERPRYYVHFTPTGSSWLNQIERWFGEITRKRIRRGSFGSVRELVKAIRDYIRQYNKNPRPFQWVASASRIIRKVNKYKEISETGD